MTAAHLAIVEGPERGREVPLDAGGAVVGRDESCTIRLADTAVSREHFRIAREERGWVLYDLGSTNRTRVNSEPVGERILVLGDLIQVGASVLQLVPAGAAVTVGGASRVTVELRAAPDRERIGDGGDPARLARYLAAMTALGRATATATDVGAAARAACKTVREALGADRVQLVALEPLAIVSDTAAAGTAAVIAVSHDVLARAAAGSAIAASDDGRELVIAPCPRRGQRGAVLALRAGRAWDRVDAELLAAAGHVIASALDALAAYARVVRDQDALRERLSAITGGEDFLGTSEAAGRVRELIARVAATDATVLLLGESGAGKELVATAIHRRSARGAGPLVCVNCAALSETLVESELFGHEKGAFTGATERRAGRFEQADGGSLFLDEVGELSPRAQAKLLRVLEERRVERIGGTPAIAVDVRLIAATNRDLAAMVRAGEFRKDLYYRLEVVVGAVPPLRERRADVPLLAERFLARFAGKRRSGLQPDALALLVAHDWPGNVRELRNVIERIAVLGESDPVSAADVARALGASGHVGPTVPAAAAAGAPQVRTLEEVERDAVVLAYETSGRNKLRAAELLGIDRTTLYKKLKRYGLD